MRVLFCIRTPQRWLSRVPAMATGYWGRGEGNKNDAIYLLCPRPPYWAFVLQYGKLFSSELLKPQETIRSIFWAPCVHLPINFERTTWQWLGDFVRQTHDCNHGENHQMSNILPLFYAKFCRWRAGHSKSDKMAPGRFFLQSLHYSNFLSSSEKWTWSP